MYNFVAKKQIIDSFKKSKHFKMNLGHSMSVDDKGQRKFRINDKDKFAKFYFNKYRIQLFSEGNIGQLNFFSDYYIEDDIVVVFFDDKDFVFVHEPHTMKDKGVDSYLGSIIKEIETKYEEEIAGAGGNVDSATANKSGGNADNLVNNPGSVTWEDIQAHIQRKKKI
jgi:hypothetical protein